MPAVILFSHGSLLCDAGRELEAHAARLRETNAYSPVEIGYLNYSSPSFAEAVEKCVASSTTEIKVAPYFLVPGYFVNQGLPKVLHAAREKFPQIEFQIAPPLGDHPLLAEGVLACARRESEKADHSSPGTRPSSLLLMVHGSPNESSNAPVFAVAQMIRERNEYSHVAVSFMECNAPSIPEAIKLLVHSGAKSIVAVPYFLHAGKHVADDLPSLLEAAQEKYPDVEFLMGDYLGREPLITEVLRARLQQARPF